MYEVIDKKKIDGMQAEEKVTGYLYLQTCEVSLTKNNKPFVKGVLYSHGSISFKAWDNSDAYTYLIQNDITKHVVLVSGVIDEFKEIKSLVLETISLVDDTGELSYLNFLETIYDADEYYDTLMTCLQKYCSDDALKVFQIVMNDSEVRDSFKQEFAAVTHHDSCKNGLLAHTTKVVKLMTFVNFYENMRQVVDYDLLFVAAALHDVGKCVEYYHGGMSEKGKIASHLTYGVLVISRYEQQIKALKGEEFYYSLIAVVSQHHGKFGESPRILVSYLVHLMDSLDTTLTDMETQIRDNRLSGLKKPVCVRDIGKLNY